MYSYSFTYFKRLFNYAIRKLKIKDNLEERIALLIKNITATVYTSVTRGLFEVHKVIISFLISTSINRESGDIKEDTWRTLLVKSVKIPSDVNKNQYKKLRQRYEVHECDFMGHCFLP